jgi:hypothetical protein
MLRSFFAFLLMFSLQLVSSMPSSAANMSIIYVSARNCGYCRGYEASMEDKIKAEAKKNLVEYRTVSVASFANISNEEEYPADLKWIPKTIRMENLTPTFLLISGHTVLKLAMGTDQLSAYIIPMIQQRLPKSSKDKDIKVETIKYDVQTGRPLSST